MATLSNTINSYGFVSKFFHWLIALIVLVMLAMGISFNYLPYKTIMILMPIHKSLGVTLLILMILRLMWRWFNPTPRFPDHMRTWEKILARLVHYFLYVAVIAMTITGIVMTLSGGHPLPFWYMGNIHLSFIPLNSALKNFMFKWHDYLAWTIGGLVAFHTIAALKHHFMDRDDVLKRMM